MKKNKKKIVVTGALGHIGSRLIRDISRSAAGHIVLIDNLHSQRYASLFDLPTDLTYEFHEADIRTADLTSLFHGADAVINLAAITNAEASVGNEREVETVNFEGLQRVAKACVSAGVPLIFPSSTSVYGSQSELVDETCAELEPQSPYADSKIKSEIFLRELKLKGLKFVTCRLGTIFGWSVGMRFHTAVNKFTWQALNGLPITVWKTAWQQKRPYLGLTDCVRAINFILEKQLFDGEIYNVVTVNSTVEEITGIIKKSIPDLKVTYVDSKIMNQLSYNVSDQKFRGVGFKPAEDIEAGIRETIAHFKSLT